MTPAEVNVSLVFILATVLHYQLIFLHQTSDLSISLLMDFVYLACCTKCLFAQSQWGKKHNRAHCLWKILFFWSSLQAARAGLMTSEPIARDGDYTDTTCRACVPSQLPHPLSQMWTPPSHSSSLVFVPSAHPICTLPREWRGEKGKR